MSTVPKATTTSYAILGLLAVRSWTTYELTRQMDRSLGRIWPRAASKLYEEPKKLVALGWARATDEAVGRRPRTTYSITAKGRRALASWLRDPGAGPVLEWEQLLKIQFADHGTKDDALATLTAARAWAIERNEENLAAGRAYAAGAGPFQERAAVNSLNGRFLTDLYALVRDWAEWATGVVEAWPDDPSHATVDQAEMDESVRRAERTARP
jgi:PadR family transcriptional regulator AphA